MCNRTIPIDWEEMNRFKTHIHQRSPGMCIGDGSYGSDVVGDDNLSRSPELLGTALQFKRSQKDVVMVNCLISK